MIRHNLTRSPLTLDEQSFEGLLSAAFTIQEHNERRKRAEPIEESEVPFAPESSPDASSTCPHCGAPKLKEAARCAGCGLDEFRPGERLQRNWASMWLKSQEQGLWPERSAEAGETVRKIGESTEQNLPPIASGMRARTGSDATTSMLGQMDMGKSVETGDWNSDAGGVDPTESAVLGIIENEGAELSLQPVESYAEAEFNHLETADVPAETGGGTAPNSMLQRLADIEVKLRFHRADLYLGVAVFVALLALLWPAASVPKRAPLSLWERALVTMGIAEAPAPVIHQQGDPSIEVWVDPHTALYYCPGAEPYGKTADGHLSSQREAQLDRFEPAGRSVCE